MANYKPYTEFLDLFEPNRRSTISNRFLFLIRAGIKTPKAICSDLLQIAQDHAKLGHDRDLVDAMLNEPEKALLYAQDRLDYEAMSYDEKQALKARQREVYTADWMETQPPTEKQLKYIKALGSSAIPSTRGEASRLIDSLLKQR